MCVILPLSDGSGICISLLCAQDKRTGQNQVQIETQCSTTDLAFADLLGNQGWAITVCPIPVVIVPSSMYTYSLYRLRPESANKAWYLPIILLRTFLCAYHVCFLFDVVSSFSMVLSLNIPSNDDNILGACTRSARHRHMVISRDIHLGKQAVLFQATSA